MKEDYNIKDPKVDDLINRLRFKLPEYDTISNYKRLLLFWLFQPFTLLT